VGELRLDRLDRVATAEQLAGLLGSSPHQALVDDVYARSKGNAYLTTLLVRGLSPDARSLPAGLPADLQEAATRAWHGLSERARAVTQLVAVAGRPQRADQLVDVAAAVHVKEDVVPLLREAVDAAVLDVSPEGTYWFVHPLQAEVLELGLLPEERRTLHAAFAVTLEPSRDADAMGVELAVGLADHHHQAGHPHEAYKWALLAADAAERAGGAIEVLRLLRRALELWPRVLDPGVSKIDLLQRIRAAAEQAGEMEGELTAVDDLLAAVDRDQQPLLAAELMVRRMQLRLMTGATSAVIDDVREAVRISAPYPDRWEHALAMAELAHCEMWNGELAGSARAQDAVRLARASGSVRALTYALTAKAMSRIGGDREGLAEAQEAQAAATKARDFYAFVHATLWAGSFLDGPASTEVIELQRRAREEMKALGAPHTYVAWLSANESYGLLLRGEWRHCEERLRVALGSTPGPIGDTIARLAAAQLAVWQGRRVEAKAHLTRAEELFVEPSRFIPFPIDGVRAELAVASGHTDQALSAALSGVIDEGEHPTQTERLIPLAARAVADQAQAARDRGEDPAPALAHLHDLQRQHPAVVADPNPGPVYQGQVRAMQVWYEAEVMRGHADPAAASAWQAAAKACADGQLAWDEAYMWWRAAEALVKDRTTRDGAAAALRRAHELAVDLHAEPLLTDIVALARSARVPLALVDENPPVDTDALSGLTRREREVLTHIVAGRTYSEIARALVLSEKTVSVHVSHLLHKTGTANRVELAQLARRVAKAADN
jgi:DNA-binding CsgD family transcriptional regulator